VPELHPGTIVSAVAILTGTGLLAALVPARRAAAVDPAITLRAD
jgi:ABC-type antimicrobial peptide transport system permease subunit